MNEYKIGDIENDQLCVGVTYGIDFKDSDGNVLLEQPFDSKADRDAHWARLVADDDDAWLHEDAARVTEWSKARWEPLTRGIGKVRRRNGSFRRNHESRYTRAGIA